jgi:hypothetical protein
MTYARNADATRIETRYSQVMHRRESSDARMQRMVLEIQPARWWQVFEGVAPPFFLMIGTRSTGPAPRVDIGDGTLILPPGHMAISRI